MFLLKNFQWGNPDQRKYFIFWFALLAILLLRVSENLPLRATYAGASFAIGKEYSQKGKSHKAISYYLKAARQNPNFALAYYMTGVEYGKRLNKNNIPPIFFMSDRFSGPG